MDIDLGMRVAAFLLGLAVVLGTIRSALRTLVLPRATPSLLVRFVFVTWRRIYSLRAGPSRPYAQRDRVLASFAPVSLLTLPVAWLALALIGFTPMMWAAGVRPWREALITSGSSVFTLGFARPEGLFPTLLCFAEAGLGFGLAGLLISYLPSIYAAFSRRETSVALLEGLAGTPPSPVDMLARHHAIGGLDRLAELFDRWQVWFADVQESHTSVPALCFFRSPRSEHSWVTAATCVLDAAALRQSSLTIPESGASAALCIRTGFVTLRHIASFFALPFDPDPRPDDAISVTREEFDEAFARLEQLGLPVKKDVDQAWRDFAGWRVNYDSVARALAALTVAAPAGWPAGDNGQYQRPSLLASVPSVTRSRERRGRPPASP